MNSNSEEAANSANISEGDQKRDDKSAFAANDNIVLPPATLEPSNTGASGNVAVVALQEEVLIDSEAEIQESQRKTLLYDAIREQIEFYFCDASLSKHRYLMRIISKEKYITIEAILRFNKLKQLTNSVEDVVESLKNSQFMEVDETGQKIRRMTPIQLEKKVFNKTLYVQVLPATAGHDWVRSLFGCFGAVEYVILPIFPKSRQPKGYGFVQYKSAASVKKAVKAFQKFGGVISTSDPLKLQSVRVHEKQKSEVNEVKEINKRKQKARLQKEKEQKGGKLSSQSSKEHMEESVVEKLEPEKDVIPKKGLKNDDKSNKIGLKNTDSALEGSLLKIHADDTTDANATENSKELKMITLNDLQILPKLDWIRLHNGQFNQGRSKKRRSSRKFVNGRKQGRESSPFVKNNLAKQ